MSSHSLGSGDTSGLVSTMRTTTSASFHSVPSSAHGSVLTHSSRGRLTDQSAVEEKQQQLFQEALDGAAKLADTTNNNSGRKKRGSSTTDGGSPKKKKRNSKKRNSGSRPTPSKKNGSGKGSKTEAESPPPSARGTESIELPEVDEIMEAERGINDIARKLPRSLQLLNHKLKEMERRIQQTHERAVLPFQIRRAQQERKHLREEIFRTEHVIRELNVMSNQMHDVLKLRDTVKAEMVQEMKDEVEALKKEKQDHYEDIRQGYINRINLLHLYWPWRQLLELGDTNVGTTFKEELDRGPRYRNVNIQNAIQSEMTDQQLKWLEEIVNREDVFRGHLNKLDALVEDLTDITDLLETALTCQVCGLLFEDPVVFWPCGHTFCYICFQSLKISSSLHRCPTCSSIGSEGFLHNLLIGESVAKWMFKDSGYGDLKGPMTNIRLHLSRFSRQNIQSRITELREAMKNRALDNLRGKVPGEELITVSYRAY